MHPETNHSVDESDHEDCVDIARDLLADLEEKAYPEHIIEIVKGIVGELEEYEADGESEAETEDGSEEGESENIDENDKPMEPMDEINKYAKEKTKKSEEDHKPALVISIGKHK